MTLLFDSVHCKSVNVLPIIVIQYATYSISFGIYLVCKDVLKVTKSINGVTVITAWFCPLQVNECIAIHCLSQYGLEYIWAT